MLVSICTACLEYSLESSINFEKGELLKETMNRRRKRDREPSRIPLKRILKVLNKKKYRKKVQPFVRQSIPKSSFITNLSQHHKIWQLWYNRDTFYSKYAWTYTNMDRGPWTTPWTRSMDHHGPPLIFKRKSPLLI